MNANTSSCGVWPMDVNAEIGTEKEMCRIICTTVYIYSACDTCLKDYQGFHGNVLIYFPLNEAVIYL